MNSLEALARDEQLALGAPQAPERPVARLTHAPVRAATPLWAVLLRGCRPRQWAKNLLVLAAPSAAGLIDRPSVAARVAGAFLVLCLLSSATYLVNDVRDREQDRNDPRKRFRPVAAGELAVGTALRAAAILAVLGLAGATAISPALGGVGLAYLTLTASYSLWWRRVVVLDIVAIAAGFALRAVAGGAATDVYLSRWFVIVTASGAVFLVAAKRYAELREQRGTVPIRTTLRRYSLARLRLTLWVSAGVGGIAYVSWAFSRPANVAWYALSIAPFLLWLARYASLIGAGAGQAPEELILRDRTLLAVSVAWTCLFLCGVYVGR